MMTKAPFKVERICAEEPIMKPLSCPLRFINLYIFWDIGPCPRFWGQRSRASAPIFTYQKYQELSSPQVFLTKNVCSLI